MNQSVQFTGLMIYFKERLIGKILLVRCNRRQNHVHAFLEPFSSHLPERLPGRMRIHSEEDVQLLEQANKVEGIP